MKPDTGLDALLDLNGYIIDQELGCWVKVEAWRVVATPDSPWYPLFAHAPRTVWKANHGIRQQSRCKAAEEIQVCRTAASV